MSKRYKLDCPKCGTLTKRKVDMMVCPQCGWQIIVDALEDESDYDEGDENYVPFGCRACGNPAYPKCMDSCPLYDD